MDGLLEVTKEAEDHAVQSDVRWDGRSRRSDGLLMLWWWRDDSRGWGTFRLVLDDRDARGSFLESLGLVEVVALQGWLGLGLARRGSLGRGRTVVSPKVLPGRNGRPVAFTIV